VNCSAAIHAAVGGVSARVSIAETIDIIVDSHAVGMRIDRFVAEHVADLSRSYARQLIESTHIRVNERSVRPSTTLKAGDQVRIELPAPQATDLIAEDIPLTIVYEDSDVVVINKPAGMVVHPAPGHPRGTLVNALLARYPDLVVAGDLRPGIVHRLDRETSGLLVVARHDQALHHLQAQQQARSMRKRYTTIVEGTFRESQGTIDAPIGRHPTDRLRMAVVANGRPARTHWQLQEQLGAYALLMVQLETGRTHQIRVHFAHQHHPVLGDPLYGPKRPRTTFGLTRQFLHASQLGFCLPTSGEWVEFQTELPADLAEVLAKIRRSVL
jgi:23S rRNA pseudouridine1911/1915/1917 synthase